MDEILNSFKPDYSNIKQVEVTVNSNAEPTRTPPQNAENYEINEETSVRNAMDSYLKKHKLDLTLLPNKKIKLSDLTQSVYKSTLADNNTLQIIETVSQETDEDLSVKETTSNFTISINSENDGDESNSEREEDELETTFETEQVNLTLQVSEKRSRKKREPSLKLQQKLSNDDLELIVNSVCERNADISIADVKKDNYIDKILRVKLLDDNIL